jgi:DNA-binding CsgD family transcriptional regulator
MSATVQALHPCPADTRAPALVAPAVGYHGPDRRRAAAPGVSWLALMLDEVGHGMLLLGEGARVLHANHIARAELGAPHPLQLADGQLRARQWHDETALFAALSAAGRGLRRLLTVGSGDQRASLAVVPLGVGDGPARVLVSLGRQRLSHQLTLECFARSHGLTGAETRVLEQLCAGTEPQRIAALHGVEISTVRTQITCIRQKTGAGDITGLLMRVARLPPIVSALRSESLAAAASGQLAIA